MCNEMFMEAGIKRKISLENNALHSPCSARLSKTLGSVLSHFDPQISRGK